MKRVILLSIILVFVHEVCNAQWPKIYGHYSYDMIGRSITSSYDRGIYIAGAERLQNGGNLVGYVIKTDVNGQLLWKRLIGETSSTSNVLGISQMADGGLIISGETSSYDIRDGFVMKLDNCGEKVWCTIINIEGVNDITENVFLADQSSISLACHQEKEYDRIWLYRLSSEGNMLWQKCIEPDTNYIFATGYNLLLTNDSCVLVTGFNYYFREPGSSLAWYSPLWVKFDLEGNQLWDLTWYGNGFIHGDFGHTVQDAAGNYYSAGSDGFQEPDMEACVYKFSPDGIPMKLMHVFQTTPAVTMGINFFLDSTLFLGGSYAINNNGYSMVIKADTAGNVIKTKDIPLYGMPIDYSVLTSDNKIVAIGERAAPGMTHWETCLFKFNQDLEYDSAYTVPRVYDSLCPHAVSPDETIELDCMIVDTEEPEKASESGRLKIYPVPASSQVTVSLPETYTIEETVNHIKTTTTWYSLKGDKTIEIYDLNGRKTDAIALPDGQTSVTFEVTGWPAGMYMARLVCKGRVWAQGKIVVAR